MPAQDINTLDINEKRTVKSVALLESSHPENHVITEATDVVPKCTFAVIQDQGFIDYLVKSDSIDFFSQLDSNLSKQPSEVTTFLSTVHLYRSELTVINREYSKLLSTFRPLSAVL